MRAFGRPAVWLTIVAGLWSLACAGRAAAGQYSCQVPASVLCQGCSTDVAITLQPGGGCRVSFSPAPAWATARPSGTVSLRIVTPAAPAPERRPGARSPGGAVSQRRKLRRRRHALSSTASSIANDFPPPSSNIGPKNFAVQAVSPQCALSNALPAFSSQVDEVSSWRRR